MTGTKNSLVAPAICSGVLIAAYLLLRPYGDSHAGTDATSAEAFASVRWLVSHVCGLLGLAAFAALALQLKAAHPTRTAGIAGSAGLAGAVLVLPYYGAEAFALHELGRAGVAGQTSALAHVAPIRDNGVAVATFGAGLLLLAVAGICLALAAQRVLRPAWAAWPIGLLMAGFLPQFYLPPVGRMAFGVAYLAAALAFAFAALRRPADVAS